MKNLLPLSLLVFVLAVVIYSCKKDDENKNPGGGGVSNIVITTNAITNIVAGGATSGGNITGDGGSAIVARGVCWSTNINPTISNSLTSDGSGLGTYSSSITGLTDGVTYYVRAYAINANDTAYGNELSFTAINTGGVTDIDGNSYTTIQIGPKEWMQENLKTTKYRNGDLIPTGLNNTQWSGTNTGAWTYYNDSSQYNNPYGKLYNWYAVADPRGLCPTGWHVPTYSEWNQLVKFLDPQADTSLAVTQSSIAGGLMKTVGDLQSGTGLWQSPNSGATNASGFSGLPGGYRLDGGNYLDIGYDGYWWSSSPSSTNDAWNRVLSHNTGSVYRGNLNKRDGFSVRCLRD